MNWIRLFLWFTAFLITSVAVAKNLIRHSWGRRMSMINLPYLLWLTGDVVFQWFFFRVRIVPTRENYSYSIHTGEIFPIDETTREKSAGIRVRGEQRYFHSLFGLESVFKPFKPTLHPIPGKAPSIFKTRLSKSFENFGSRKQTTFSLFLQYQYSV